jgi:hypothetical protein
MAIDSEPIRIVKTNDAVGTMFVDMLSKINFKIAFFLLFAFIIISSDVFVNRILYNFGGATEGKNTTNYGAALQGMFLALGYIIMDIFVRSGVI